MNKEQPIKGKEEILSDELKMMSWWIDKIGTDNTETTRGAAKIKIGSALKRMLDETLIAEGEKRLFTLKEALDIWSQSSKVEANCTTQTKEQYFKEKFGILLSSEQKVKNSL